MARKWRQGVVTPLTESASPQALKHETLCYKGYVRGRPTTHLQTIPTACPTMLTAAAVLDTLSAFALIFLNKILDQKKK